MAAATAVATAPATTVGTAARLTMEAAATLMSDGCATATVVELGVVAVATPMVFPRMVNHEDRIIATPSTI